MESPSAVNAQGLINKAVVGQFGGGLAAHHFPPGQIIFATVKDKDELCLPPDDVGLEWDGYTSR